MVEAGSEAGGGVLLEPAAVAGTAQAEEACESAGVNC